MSLNSQFHWLCGLSVCLLAVGCHSNPPAVVAPAKAPTPSAAASAPRSAIRFDDRTAESGVEFTYRNGHEAGKAAILESLGGGVAVLDFDLDGALDLFLPGGGGYRGERALFGLPAGMFRNLGDWKFVPVVEQAGLPAAKYYTHGASVGDYDADGFPDVIVTGYGGVQLYHNLGDGTFQETTLETGLTDPLWSSSAAWADFNGDGHLDLYVAHYVNWSFDNDPFCKAPQPGVREICPPRDFKGLPDTLYLSQGDGSFRDASKEGGLRPDGKGLGVVASDLDLDGDTDVYVANDTVANFLYRNDGTGKFEEIGERSGAALSDMGTPDGSMGLVIADLNLDGLPDIWVANYERESFALYRNTGKFYQHVSQATGITAVGDLFVGFGTVAFDVDLDGDEDIVVSNGHVILYPNNSSVRQLPLLFENLNGKRFVNVAPTAGPYFSEPHLGRGVIRADFDDDGRLDLAFSPIEEPVSLLQNATATEGRSLLVRLVGVTSNRDGTGASLVLHTSQGDYYRPVVGGGSYLSQSDPRPFWGLPVGTQVQKLTVRWPDGQTDEIELPETSEKLTLIQRP
ncbi:MAG TPA: CRTAC1 family protein, partial [Planctomycetaceae bacterium]|nr:CRTAC1 family protein [Planctomycetaceae bacterium]